ncbi:hypothetical protein M0R45_020638 [Rubus argutus]|uniref:Xylanase inhibitor C-terminal domain-containing protein n=1 Tax=Rubus argutus TaxID=59490 RepID=A0AAW1X9E5_RUBAR
MGLILPSSFLFPTYSLFAVKHVSYHNLQPVSRALLALAGLKSGFLPNLLPLLASTENSLFACPHQEDISYGVVFFGDGPYNLLPGIEISKSLIYTPLILNPVTTSGAYVEGEPSAEYFINVTSIKINGKVVSGFNTSLLTIDENGYGGTKISSVNPYTVMETSIYNAFVDLFVKELAGVPRVTPVEPFGVCFNSTNLGSTRVGPPVPAIDLVLQSESVYWRIFGANSMVQVSNDVLCLGFVDNGQSPSSPRTNIVIGAHQIGGNLLQFDLSSSRLGFSSSLLFRQTTCANFNFTSIA